MSTATWLFIPLIVLVPRLIVNVLTIHQCHLIILFYKSVFYSNFLFSNNKYNVLIFFGALFGSPKFLLIVFVSLLNHLCWWLTGPFRFCQPGMTALFESLRQKVGVSWSALIMHTEWASQPSLAPGTPRGWSVEEETDRSVTDNTKLLFFFLCHNHLGRHSLSFLYCFITGLCVEAASTGTSAAGDYETAQSHRGLHQNQERWQGVCHRQLWCLHHLGPCVSDPSGNTNVDRVCGKVKEPKKYNQEVLASKLCLKKY